MKLLLFIVSTPFHILSQGTNAMSQVTIPVSNVVLTDSVSPKKDTLNAIDESGKKQGTWIILGGEVPNSGVASTDILEKGSYRDNERTGVWTRFGSKGEVKAVMRYSINPKTKAAERDQFYHYSYFPGGKLQRKPVIGDCPSASDYFVYAESGELKEAEIFDKDCNTSVKLQSIKKGELDSIDLFKPVYGFKPTSDIAPQTAIEIRNFEQDGEFCVDYLHKLFQIGTFKNGILIEGKEIEVDEMMRPLKVSFISGGKVVKVGVK